MQPLISPIDHESRYSSYRASDEPPSESTPLVSSSQVIRTFARTTDLVTKITVIALLLILITGVVISIYLLVQQEDVLPPAEYALNLVNRDQWNFIENNNTEYPLSLPANHIIVMQTDTEQCLDNISCIELLLSMKNKTGRDLPYNFLVAPSGQTFQELGWQTASSLFPNFSNTSLVLAFIGNYTTVSPPAKLLNAAERFIDESLSLDWLKPSFTIIGKNSNYVPIKLFQQLQKLPQWDWHQSD